MFASYLLLVLWIIRLVPTTHAHTGNDAEYLLNTVLKRDATSLSRNAYLDLEATSGATNYCSDCDNDEVIVTVDGTSTIWTILLDSTISTLVTTTSTEKQH